MAATMAAAAAADQKLEVTCSICKDIYTNPVTLICGHSFCQDCITKTFDNQHDNEYFCTECMKEFRRRPELNKNPRLSNIAEYFHSVEPKTDQTESYSSVGGAGKAVRVKDARTLPLSAAYDKIRREKDKSQKGVIARVKPPVPEKPHMKPLEKFSDKEDLELKKRKEALERRLAELKERFEKEAAERRLAEMKERFEKKTLERRIAVMEEELKILADLKADIQRLKDENGALIRVISKLSK